MNFPQFQNFCGIIMPMGKDHSTTKSMIHNKTYRRNHRTLLSVLFRLLRTNRGSITIPQLARSAKMSTQTVYQHFSDINSAITDSESEILEEYKTAMGRWRHAALASSDANGRLFYMSLIFMAKHRDVFVPICSDINNQGLLYQMMAALIGAQDVVWLPKGSPAPAPGSERADMLIWTMMEIVNRWSNDTDCAINQSRRYIERIKRAVDDAAKNRLP